MDSDYTAVIKGRTLEYLAEPHLYVVDGVLVPNITSIAGSLNPHKYRMVSRQVLDAAAAAGVAVHDAIEAYCKHGTESSLPEVAGFKFLQKSVPFEVLENETPVILEVDGIPAAAGRLDLVVKTSDGVGGVDIKRTSQLDKKYLALQLNLYRLAYRHSYGVEWDFLAALHLRDKIRKWVDIPIDEQLAINAVKGFLKGASNE